MKNIALYNGSFNPPHDGHMEVAACVQQALDLDEIWLLFAMNPQKNPASYAPVKHRMAMTKIMARHYPDLPLMISDLAKDLGTDEIYEILHALKKKQPDNHIVWMMGADSMLTLHHWKYADKLMQDFNIAVIGRPGYTEKALNSPIARKYRHLYKENPQDLLKTSPGWAIIDPANERAGSDNASHKLLQRLRRGNQSGFSRAFNEVATYIRKHGLYNIGKKQKPPTPRR